MFYLVGTLLRQGGADESPWNPAERIQLVDLEEWMQSATDLQRTNLAGQAQAEQMLLDTLGKTSPEGAAALGRLAGIHALQGDYTRAEREYRELKALLEEHLGADHADVALTEQNLRTLTTLRTNTGARLPTPSDTPPADNR